MNGNLNISNNDELDSAYDLMVHNQQSDTPDDTYDHTSSKGQLFDTMIRSSL